MKRIELSWLVASLSAGVLWPSLADAQLTIDPEATQPAPPPAPAGRPPIIINAGPEGAEGDAEVDMTNIHLDDYLGDGDFGEMEEDSGRTRVHGGAVPDVHVVREDDTLWEISSLYFSDPWQWPRVWSYNPEITNPHWIYPGNLVRLRPEGEAVPVVETPIDDELEVQAATPVVRRKQRLGLRHHAFLAPEDLKSAAVVDGSTREKQLLGEGDSIYLTYPDGRAPKVGKRYAIYGERKAVKHPESGDEVGSYVIIVGELEVQSVKKDRRARALITASNDVIERGMLVGRIESTFGDVQPKTAQVDLDGTIIEQLEADVLIGARQAVIIDRGKSDKVGVGNRFYVVRRGDAYRKVMGPASNVGQDDARFPARAIGEILVVQVGDSVSLGFVTRSVHEFAVGDRVIMRRGR